MSTLGARTRPDPRVERPLSLSEISARIAQIQSLVSPPSTASTMVTTTSGTDFASTLAGALGTSSVGSAAASSSTTGRSASVLAALGGGATAGASTRADGDDIASWATKFVGTPYVAGGRSPSTGWDCAGFTQWVAKQYGVTIPDVSWEQIKTGAPVASIGSAKPGDLLFFHEPGGHRHDPSPLGVNHVAIYLGGGKMVEAANPHAGTRISSVDSSHLVGIRRIAAAGDGTARTPAQVAAAAGLSGLTGLTSMSGLSSLSASAASSSVSSTSSATGVRPTGSLSPHQLVDVLRKAGFSGEGLHVAWAVAMRESHGRPGALGAVNPNGTRDHGLFQLNDIHLGRSIDSTNVYDAGANASAAYRMSKHGTDWSAWGIGHTGWAAHLETAQPATYATINSRFQEWYARFPGA